MPITAKILADSLAPCGKRLTTFECKYPRVIHSEIMTHRMLSRNSASSRAIPTEKLIKMVENDPFIPVYIGANQKGMQAGQELNEEDRTKAVTMWLAAKEAAIYHASVLNRMGVHKQVINRLLEPWMWITVIISATEWTNFFGLRRHEHAEPHFQELANKMWDAMKASEPKQLRKDGWHLPLVDVDSEDSFALGKYIDGMMVEARARGEVTINLDFLAKISVGRVARVSYLTHDGRRDPAEDIALHDRLVVQEPLHASPAEHIAQALATPERIGNFIGWRQYRKTLPNEHIGGPMP